VKRSRSHLAVLFILLPASVLALDSPMFRGDPQHSGIYDATGVPKFNQIKWKFHTDGRVFSSPAVVKDTVYFGSTDHYLYAVDLETGKMKWRGKTGSRVTSSPAVDNDTVYFGSYDGIFYAIDVGSGKLKWKFQTAGERRYAATHLHGSQPVAETMPDPFDVYLSSPVIWKGKVYFGSGDGNVYALDAGSGKLLWKFKTGDVVHASPAIADGTLFVGSWDSYFYALDAATGKQRWRFKTGEDPAIHNQVGIQSSPVVADSVVYFGCRDSNLYALDAKTGQKRWAYNTKGSWVISSPTVKDGKVYFSTSDSGLLFALDAKSAEPVFSLKLGWPMFSSPAIAGNMLYIGTHEGKLAAIDLATQKLAWSFPTDGSRQNGATYTKADGSPNYEAAFEDDFYDDVIVGVNKMLSVGAILSSPVVVKDVIYVGSSDGNLYALR
jgi:eukaryotic-like serine/threonine-protein kinase